MRSVRISEEAAAELEEATRWYEAHRLGLGTDFLSVIDSAVEEITRNPKIGSPAPGVEDHDVRRLIVRRFPYHLVYIELTDRIQVLAVAHERQRPGYWKSRLPTE